MKYLKFDKIVNEKIWGKEEWILSAHPQGDCLLTNSKQKFSDYYLEHKNIFNNKNSQEFPLLIKVITANEDLSIQVHPDNEYAKTHENSLGKQESWLILDCNKDATIIVGQKEGITIEDISEGLENNTILDLLNIEKINPGDFFDIPPGTIHAIRAGTTILEIQQSSDITYRLYDYNRCNSQGNLRDLHIQKSLDVISTNPNNIPTNHGNTLVENEFYYIDKLVLEDSTTLTVKDNYQIIIPLVEGFLIEGEPIHKYEAVLIFKNETITLTGTGAYILTGELR